MSRGQSLLNNTAVYAVGNFGSKILSFALVPLFSFFVSKEDLGVYDLMLTAVALFFPVVTIQLSEALYRWLIAEKNVNQRKIIISTGLLSVMFLLFLFGVIYLITSCFINFKYKQYFYFLLIGGSLFPVFQQVIRGLGLNKLYSLIGILNAISLVTLNFIFLYALDYGVEGILLSSIIAYFLSVFVSAWKGGLSYYISFKYLKFHELKSMTKYSIPLIPNAISWWLINASNRFIILQMMSLEYNGVFAVSARFPAILAIINSIFMLAWQDLAISNFETNEDKRFASKLFDTFLRVELCIIILLIPLSRFAVEFIVEESFRSSWSYMPLLFLGTAFSAFSAFFGSAYLRNRKTTNLVFTTAIGGFINIIITYLLTPRMGLYAAGIGTSLGFLIVFLIRVYDLRNSFYLNVNWRTLISLTIAFVVFFLFSLADKLWIHLSTFVIGCLLFSFLNKEVLFKIRMVILSKLNLLR